MDDAAAVARAGAGDSEAFRLLIERHGRALYRLAYRMTGNAQDAEDVVQEAFLKAYRSLHRFEGRSQVGTWLHRITANCALDALRARQRQERHLVRSDRDTPSEPRAVSPGPDRWLAGGDVRRGVRAALGRMSPRERATFALRHFEGLSLQEIGHVLELDPEAVRQSICRAVRKARTVLAPLVGVV
jgi:RNA polymerase sigma-70 factor (ECF subfamily)